MKIEDELNIEISQTISKIRDTDQMIKFHRNQDEFSELTVAQYKKIKEDFINQLNDLLKNNT